jgi:two-component system cell cycle sensor histidine kinase/response regulator CckA
MEQQKRIADQLSQVDDPRALLEGLFANAPVALQIYKADGHCLLSNQAFRDLFGSEPPPDYNVFKDDILAGEGMAPLITRAFAGETIHLPTVWYDPRELRQVRVTDARRVAVASTFLPLFDEQGVVRHVAICVKDVTAEQEFKAASQALLLREEELVATLDSIGDGVIATDTEGRVIRMNPVAERLTGWSKAEAAEKSLAEVFRIVHQDTREPLENPAMRVLRRAGPSWLPSHTLLLGRDGSEHIVADTGAPIRDREGNTRGVVLVFRDVSEEYRREIERSKSAEAIRLSEARYRTQFEAAPEAIVTLDVDQGRFVEVNQNAERLFGYKREELFRMNPSDLSPAFQPDGRASAEGVRANVERALAGEKPVFEWTHRNAAGHQILCEIRLVRLPASGQNLCRGSIVDISERKRAEAARARLEGELRVSEVSYREIFDNASDAIIVLDLATFRVLDANVRASEVTGYGKDELLNSDSAEQYLDEPGFTRRDGLSRLRLAASGAAQLFEWKARHKSGRPYFAEMSLRRARIAGQDRLLLFLRDITERKRLEQTLRQTEDQLRHSQKMEAIGRLAGGVAHDFNNLLSVVLGYSTLVLASLDPGDPRAADVAEIKTAGERAAKLTKQLLAFSRQQVLAPAVVDLNDIVARMDHMLRRVIGEDIHLSTQMEAGLGRVKVDEGQIEQVIMNLAVNARDAMPGGGTLTIATDNVALDEEYARAHRGISPGPHVRLVVSDTGVGMDSGVQSRIFEPFFTTKEKGKGTGLGLSTVLGIVEQSGGSVEVHSDAGKGTTFKVHLPTTADRLEPPRSLTPPRVLIGSETLLLVEDEERLRALSRAVLANAGYRVIAAESAADALEHCLRFPSTIHLLVTDVIMPDMNGRVLAERATRIRPDMKVLYVSGYADNSLFDLQGLHQRIAFLQKPITPDVLLRKVRETLDSGQ